MPVHTFQSEGGQTIDVYVPATAPATQHQLQVKDGVCYKRVYAVPLAATNMGTRLGDGTSKDFARATSDKRGLKVGDCWEISAEMGEKRKQQQGIDPVREQFYADYEKEHGEKHRDVVVKERVARTNARLKEWGVQVNL